ncbi:carboxylesterase [Penicillium longicatenatum]|uniref:carboxylesterase n=1 Tax=Penicillium longicatenatum TaxID=1561947 RepID=UPI002547A8B3|nr:carboxylesterase [Penicillium longicatenatum]KAJ5635900.1 carboxylesterase [Penicillium longicatenatum]
MRGLNFLNYIFQVFSILSLLLPREAFGTVTCRRNGHLECLPRAPTAETRNGTYHGIHNDNYNQDFFLGIPYAQQPVGYLRLRTPQSLNESWTMPRNATEYSPACVGYKQSVGASEACLTLNVIRPSGVSPNERLPVAVWIYGGGFTSGSSANQQYNLSFIVEESVKVSSPIIAVSLNYRLHCWGFMWSKEIKEAGVGNLGFRDQRLALHWIQENIDAFGGDPSKVTIWGESAGANSVGTQLIAYGGRDDGLFRAAISESGAPSTYDRYQIPKDWQPYYDAIVEAANCNFASDTLTCLRTVPTNKLHAIFDNSSIVPVHTLTGLTGPQFVQVIDGDLIQESATVQLQQGKFVKVPYIIGANADEGTSFAVSGISTDEQFQTLVASWGLDNATVAILTALYPNIPEIGIPASMVGSPPAGYGDQYKRVAAFQGDVNIHAGRRLASQAWAKHNVSAYSYLFDVINHGAGPLVGADHGSEIAYVFDNVDGVGYAVGQNPMENEAPSYQHVAKKMSRFWISFFADMTPNHSQDNHEDWPSYNLQNPEIILFNTKFESPALVIPDTYRAEGIDYISKNLATSFGH